jgi:hypothetical protein
MHHSPRAPGMVPLFAIRKESQETRSRAGKFWVPENALNYHFHSIRANHGVRDHNNGDVLPQNRSPAPKAKR